MFGAGAAVFVERETRAGLQMRRLGRCWSASEGQRGQRRCGACAQVDGLWAAIMCLRK